MFSGLIIEEAQRLVDLDVSRETSGFLSFGVTQLPGERYTATVRKGFLMADLKICMEFVLIFAFLADFR